MGKIKIVNISKNKKREKLAFSFPVELIEKAQWQKVRRIYFSIENRGNFNDVVIMQGIRTRTNTERVNNIRLPKGSTIKLDLSYRYRGIKNAN
ncbi:hypothetical protein IGI65_001574 [Enterococcus sp. DIV0755b]|uniref:hypothetical protein n=1 Tax=Enterococcus sp. DIV0755b TaxID=2774657 RepID=UPI003F20CA97